MLFYFISGLTKFFSLTGYNFNKNPYSYPEKSLSYDWELLGDDISEAIMKLGKKVNQNNINNN